MIVGREREQQQLAAMAAAAGRGHSSALLLRGPAGIGKSTLLRELAETAGEGLRVLSCVGVQSETDLPYATLHQLVRPLLGFDVRLPPPQKGALHSAFGMDSAPAEQLLVALAALTLLSEAAAKTPLLLLVDDAQWVDSSSAAVFGFVARRLGAEGVAMVLSVREGCPFPAGAGIPEMQLPPLDERAAEYLLTARLPDMAPTVRQRLLRQAEGNPLALGELPAILSRDQLLGARALPDHLPLTERLTRVFLHRAAPLLTPENEVLLLAATESDSALDTVLRAAHSCARSLSILHEAAAAQLITLDGESIRFRHPLIRSAIYHHASPRQRRAAHLALADALPQGDDRRIWHLAAAASGPDEAIAQQLGALARRARRAGAVSTAAKALRRAAALTTTPRQRARWLIEAAECTWMIAEYAQAEHLLTQAAPLADSVGLRAQLARVRGAITHASSNPSVACTILLDGARAALEPDPELASQLLVMAARSAWVANDPGRLEEIARLLDRVDPTAGGTPSAMYAAQFRYLSGLGSDEVTARPSRDVAVQSGTFSYLPSRETEAWSGPPTFLPYLLGTTDSALDAYQRVVEPLHRAGTVGALPMSLAPMAALQLATGRWPDAMTNAAQGLLVAEETRQLGACSHLHALLAWLTAVTGDRSTSSEHAARSLALAEPLRIVSAAALAHWSLGLNALADNDTDQAAHFLTEVTDADGRHSHFMISWLVYPDLIEALVRGGKRDRARRALDQFESRVVTGSSLQLHASLQRCRGLLAGADEAESLFLDAQRGTGLSQFDVGRSQLLFGEWLRRRHRVKEAREQLRLAEQRLACVGATPWAELARTELRAAGTRPVHDPPAVAPAASVAQLTARELQVARLAAQGLSNSEIGGRLFISARTVGYHLYKLFPKLGVTSRNQLRAQLLD